MQVDVLLQKGNIEGAIHYMEDLVEVTENLETPTFPTDLDTAIDVVNQTLTRLVDKLKVNMSGHKMNEVSRIIPSCT